MQKVSGQAVNNLQKAGGQAVNNLQKAGGQAVNNLQKAGGQAVNNLQKAGGHLQKVAGQAVNNLQKAGGHLQKVAGQAVNNLQKAGGQAVNNLQKAGGHLQKVAGQAVNNLKKFGGQVVENGKKLLKKADTVIKKAAACIKKDGLGKCIEKGKQVASALLNKACKKANLPAVCKATIGKGCKTVVNVLKTGALAVTDTAAKAAAALLNAFLNAMDSIVAHLSIDITVQGSLSAQHVALGIDFAVAWGSSRLAFSAHLELSVGGIAKLVGAIMDKIKSFFTSKFKL